MPQTGQLTSQADLTKATEVICFIWCSGCSRKMTQMADCFLVSQAVFADKNSQISQASRYGSSRLCK